MKNLISNTEFGEYLESIEVSNSCYRMLRKNFDSFLRQLLEIWQFVPCKLVEGVWVVLEEPFNDGENDNYYLSAMQEYQQAKERCLFYGVNSFEIVNSKIRIQFTSIKLNDKNYECSIFDLNSPIEDLVRCNLKLTKTAKKQIGL